MFGMVFAMLLMGVGVAGAAVVAENRIVADTTGGIGVTALFIDQEFEDTTGAGFPDFTGAIFELVSTTAHDYRYDGTFLDSGVDVYFVGEMDEFSVPRIAAGDFTPLVFNTVYDFQFSNEIYLGFVMPSAAAGVGPHPPAYAWARIASGEVPGGLRQLFVLETATAFDSQGIIVATTQAIPEPASGALVAMLAGLALRRRRSGD